MKKIKMLVSQCGCEDGFKVRYFDADKEYEVADGLASRFLRDGFAVLVKREQRPVSTNPATRQFIETEADKQRAWMNNSLGIRPAYAAACLSDAVYGTDKAAEFQTEGGGI